MSLNNKQMSLYHTATIQLYPKETKSKKTERKWQKCLWVWCLISAWSNYFWPTGHFTKSWQLAGHFQ